MKIKIDNKTIDYWINTLIPKYDVWLFTQKPEFENIEILTIDKYLSLFDKIEYNNAYCHWLIRKNAKFVIIDKNNWFNTLSKKDQEYVLNNQIIVDRGLIIQADSEKLTNPIFNNYIFNKKLVICNSLFRKLDCEMKTKIAIGYAKDQEEWDCEIIPKDTPKHIKQIANNFVLNDGCNCLSTTLFAITKDDKYLTKWVEQEEFESVIKNFNKVNIIEDNCVIVFKDKDTIIHSCFAINNNLCLNKSGQSKFNPITIQKIDNVIKDWKSSKIEIYNTSIKFNTK